MDRLIYALFLFMLLFAPVAFGTVELWSFIILETVSLLAVTLLFLKKITSKEPLFVIPGMVPLGIFLAYMVFHIVPLPPGLIKIISPETYALYSETVWTGVQPSWASFSISRKPAVTEFFRIAAYASCYILTIQLLADRRLLRKTVTAVIVFSSLLALFSLFQHILSNNKIFWLRELTQGGIPFGPFVNRNHYAGFMGMVFPLVLTMFLFHRPDIAGETLRKRLHQFFSQDKTNLHLLLGFAAILIAVSIFLSISRGGIASLSLSMFLLGLMLVHKGEKSRRGLLIILTFVLVLYSVGWFGWDPIFERFERIRDAEGKIAELRIDIWKDTIRIAKDFPVTGTGFGSFASIYPKYRSISADGIVDHAHNDFLELLAEGGLAALLLLAWFVASVVHRSYRVFLKRKELYPQYLFLGSITGVFTMLFHSITDFNLHIGANGLYFFFLSGLAVAAAHTSSHDMNKGTYLVTFRMPLSKKLTILSSSVLLLCILFSTGVFAGRVFFYASGIADIDEKTSQAELSARKEKARIAAVSDPLEPHYQSAIAKAEWLLSNTGNALHYYKKAVALNPSDSAGLQMLGLAMSELGQFDAADRLLSAGTSYEPLNPSRHSTYALWLFSQGKKETAVSNMKDAISLSTAKTGEYITLMILNGLKDDEIRNAIPPKSDALIIFGDYLLQTGSTAEAADEYRKVLTLDPDNGIAKKKLQEITR